jgi:hypothetical protein
MRLVPPKVLVKLILAPQKIPAQRKTLALLKSNVAPAILVQPKTPALPRTLAPQKKAKE